MIKKALAIWVCCLGSAFGLEPSASGPVAWWTFNAGDVSGITTYDHAGSHHGDLTDGAEFVTGRWGGGIRFDGANGSLICDSAPALGQNFTLAAWFKSDHLSESRWHSIYSGSGKGCPYFRVHDDGALALVSADVSVLAHSRGRVVSGEWHHVAVTYSEDGRYAFYIQGQPAGSGKVTPVLFADAVRVSLGRVATGGPPRPMKGELDDVRAYDRVLSGEEISVLAQSGDLESASADSIAARRKPTLTLLLRAKADDQWFTFGDPVVFAPVAHVSEEITALRGTVVDALDNRVADVVVSRESLVSEGWGWSPPHPGYFEIAFTLITKAGEQPLVTRYSQQTSRGTVREFERQRWAVAVMPPVRDRRLRQFGFSYGNGGEWEMRLARHVGLLGFARWHLIPWGAKFVDESVAVEPEEGKYRWEITDPHVSLFKQYGLPPEDIVGNVCFTPAWASPHPEDRSIQIGAIARTVYAPVRMEVFSNFMRALVSRYQNDIRVWEIWNEPHLPGGSIFWKDTPENFVKLMRAGYAAVKEVQPDAEVWIGGMGGRRYLPFYEALLKAGGVPFDRIPMHGSWQEISGFRELERKYGMESKPWVSSEWHAILIRASRNPPSEAELALRMIVDLCYQLQTGVERVALFNMRESGEKELLPVAFADGSFQGSSGLFRFSPRMEPRLPAVTMRTFLDQVESHLVYRGVSDLDPEQRLVWFDDAGATLAVLWTEGAAAPVDARLQPMLVSACVTTGEGYPLTIADDPMMVEPTRLYFIRNIPAADLAALPRSTATLHPEERVAKTLKDVPSGVYTRKRILNDALQPEAANVMWNEKDWTYFELLSPEAEGFSARFAVSLGARALELMVEVTDRVHVQDEPFPRYWEGDSVQFGLDADGTAGSGGQTEYVLALTADGPVLFKSAVASLGGGIPERWSSAGRPLEHGRARIVREGDKTFYFARIDASELYPYLPDTDKPLRFSLLVNNNDGKGRAGFRQWSGGIGAEKDGSYYGVLNPR
ncbi:MAG: LamG-like jellyroll fold domain-containing protein [Kiritimatiellia bacterium]|nr:LamG-like jellyroll fold domain-containing protein [Kiritimatiellia bacterium]